jgi:hypothetical protein
MIASKKSLRRTVVDMGAARISDRKRKKIILDKVEGLSYRAVAKKHGVSEYAVRKIVASDPEFAQKLAREKARNARAMVEYLDEQRGAAQEIIGKMLSAMTSEDKLAESGIRDIATAMGILIDKFTAASAASAPDNGMLAAISDVLSRRRDEHD